MRRQDRSKDAVKAAFAVMGRAANWQPTKVQIVCLRELVGEGGTDAEQ